MLIEGLLAIDEAIAYGWDLANIVLKASEEQSLTAPAEKTYAVARRYSSAPGSEHWVGMLRELPQQIGVRPFTS